jgi:hypothetical protein
MIKTIKNITEPFIRLSPLLSLPVWFLTGLLTMAAFGYEKLLLFFFTIGIFNWYFLMVDVETHNSSIEKENKIGDLLFVTYVTISIAFSIYVILNYGDIILKAFLQK